MKLNKMWVIASLAVALFLLISSVWTMAGENEKPTIVAQDPSKEVIPVATTTPSDPFQKIIGRFAAGGQNPVTLQITGVGVDGKFEIGEYTFRGNKLPVQSAVASLTGRKDMPIRLDITAGEAGGVKWELYYADTFGGMLKGFVYYGERRGENALYRQRE